VTNPLGDNFLQLNKSRHVNKDDFLIRMQYDTLVTCINRSSMFDFSAFVLDNNMMLIRDVKREPENR